MEMKGDSNNTFHGGWQKIEETQQLIKQQFPSNMEKFKSPLHKLFSASHTWIAWH